MDSFPIRTFTIVNSDRQSILHSPALPRLGVPYLDVSESRAWRVTITAFEDAKQDAKQDAVLSDGELRIQVGIDEFARLEKMLLAAPLRQSGKRYPYSVIESPPCIEFEVDNDRVVKLVLPG